MPVAELSGRLSELSELERKPIVLVCRTHKTSGTAASQLQAAGFSDVRVVHGGMVKWNELGLPVDGHRSSVEAGGAR